MGRWFRDIWDAVYTVSYGMWITMRYWLMTYQPERKTFTEHFEYPELPVPVSARYRGFHRYDLTTCIACDQCAKACPVDCIYIGKERVTNGKGFKITGFTIDYSKCMFCALCVEPCPVDCIFMGATHDLSCYSRDGCLVDFARLAGRRGLGKVDSEPHGRGRFEDHCRARPRRTESVTHCDAPRNFSGRVLSMADDYRPAKLFTVEQANAVLPLVRAITADLVQLSREVMERRERLVAALRAAATPRQGSLLRGTGPDRGRARQGYRTAPGLRRRTAGLGRRAQEWAGGPRRFPLPDGRSHRFLVLETGRAGGHSLARVAMPVLRVASRWSPEAWPMKAIGSKMSRSDGLPASGLLS